MDKLVKEYRFGFEVWGLVLFIGIMLPNFVWFAVPAPNDILRGESVTEIADIIGASVTSVTTRLSRARERLKDMLSREE